MRSAPVPILVFALAGCDPGLGTGDPEAARDVVFDVDDGLPLYAGQALLQRSCGDAKFCHTSGIQSQNRVGAPAGLDFDLSLACGPSECCTDRECRSLAEECCRLGTCLEADEDEAACRARVESAELTRLDAERARLRASQSTVFSRRDHLYGVVLDGTMPPGKAGEEVLGSAYGRSVEGGMVTDLLPSIQSPEGQDVLRNWLAAGAPLIASAQTSVSREAGSACGGDDLGNCVIRARVLNLSPLDAGEARTWSEIHDRVITRVCLECHQPGKPNFARGIQELDLREAETSLAMLVDRPASGEGCSGTGTLIVPGDPAASIFFQKLALDTTACGEVMPDGGEPLPAEIVAEIEAWIEAGARL